jgi:hypothetical protein
LWSAEVASGPTGAEVVAIAQEHDRRARFGQRLGGTVLDIGWAAVRFAAPAQGAA